MKPTRVWAKNYGPYTDVDWAIPEGVTAILGRNETGEGISSNGAGKTRLLELLPISLWGPTGPWTDYITTGSAAASCEVGCEFEHAGGIYRVRRTFSIAGRGKTTLDFEAHNAGESFEGARGPHAFWEPLTQENQAATQEAIRRLIGLGEETFNHSGFAAQGARHFADAELTPRERMEILADGLGLDVWDRFRDKASSDRQRLQTELEGLRAKLGDWEHQLAGRAEVEQQVVVVAEQVKRIEADLAAARATQERLDGEYATAREARTAIDAASQECSLLQEAVVRLERQLENATAAKAEAESLTASIEDLRLKSMNMDVLAARVDELRLAGSARELALEQMRRLNHGADNERAAGDDLLSKATQIDSEVVAKTDALSRLQEAGTGTCDRCQQPIVGASLETTLAGLRAELEALAEKAKQFRTDMEERNLTADTLAAQAKAVVLPPDTDAEGLAVAMQQLEAARTAALELARVEERQSALRGQAAGADDPEFVASLEKTKTDAEAATARTAELSASVVPEETVQILARDALGARLNAEAHETALGTARTTLGAAQERARALEDIAGRNAEAIGIANRLEFDIEVRKELERAYGRSGIPVLLLESLYIPQIQNEADRVLEGWGVPYTVELVTQKLQKTVERLKDTCEVVIHEPRGIRRYQTYSGGERDRINVALRIALVRVLSHRRGATLEVFALDELAHLDAAGIDKLAELLAELQQEIPVVLFISHDSQLTDAFAQRVTVVRDGGASRLEAAA